MGTKILWADDEIELLKPHIMFLENKGYEMTTVNDGSEAIEEIQSKDFDIVFLDENMPGLTGLETLDRIKEAKPMVPVVMITKSEEESIMEEAIGGKIADYLIKPVNPNQILLSIKKNLDTDRLVNEKTNSSYQREFRELGMRIQDRLDSGEWVELYEKLVFWELELENSEDPGMQEIIQMQKREANGLFSKFFETNYLSWINGTADDVPQMSHTLIKNKVIPELSNQPTYLMLIDNLRLDQWKVIQPILQKMFRPDKDEVYYSILPTTTQYARNAFFAGLMPSEIQKKFPDKWLNDGDGGGKNQSEKDFLGWNLKRLGQDIKFSYNKITNHAAGKKLVDNFGNLQNNDLNVIVYNFVDMLSHARTEMEVIRELADDEAAYRSLTISWFEHSSLFEMFRKIADLKAKVIITTDHGSVRVSDPKKVVGHKNTTTNLRYKQGKNIDFNKKDVFFVRDPQDAFLPKQNVTGEYIFAKDNGYFVYPNNYNHYVKYYNDTFQHGGISLEEVLIPFAVLNGK